MPQLTLLTRHPNNWHATQLRQAAERAHVTFNAVTLDNINKLERQLEEVSPVVYWRGSELDKLSEQAVLGRMLADRAVINAELFNNVFLAYKLYQQRLVGLHTKIPTIPTFRFATATSLLDAIKEGKLSYPFIAKPNLGQQGDGVLLLKNHADITAAAITYANYVFQPFIENNGDWRVIVVGHKALGAMKRVAQPGGFLNNISRGATAFKETDTAIYEQLEKISLICAELFKLDVCGLDIIQDRQTGRLYFLEINHIPGWDSEYGFQNIVGVNVADAVIEFAQAMGDVKGKQIVGEQTLVAFPEHGLTEVAAKIDTGAYYSSIHTSFAEVAPKRGGEILRYKLMDGEELYTTDKFQKVPIRSSNGKLSHRYLVILPVRIAGQSVRGQFTLADRSAMTKPVLLGRELLKNRFIVDVARGVQ